MSLEITGERVTIGHADSRNQQDHLDRYHFTSSFVANKRVLDIACGTGFGSKIIADAGASSVLGVDISAESIAYATTHHSGLGITYLCASADSLLLQDAQFDVAVSFETIEHLEDSIRKKYLQELHRVLKKDGLLIISTPNKKITTPWRKKPNNPFHVLEFTFDTLCSELQDSGFRVTDVYGQRFVRTFMTWYPFRKSVRLIEKICNKRFHIYDIASGPGVKKGLKGYQQRYFVLVCSKVIN